MFKDSKKIAYIVENYPDKLETFILSEMKGLLGLGFDIYVCPIHHSSTKSDGEKEQMPTAIYTELFNIPYIVLAHLYFMLFKPARYFRCLVGHIHYGGKRVFLKSIYFARMIQKNSIKHIHAHFGWRATDSARLISKLIGVPFSFSVHAADIYFLPDNLGEKLEEAKFVLTCVKNNKKYIVDTFGQRTNEKVDTVYHGVNLDLFRPLETADWDAEILSIGNLVEKKGHRYLIEACAAAKQKGIALKCIIVGDGPERKKLLNMINELDLSKCIRIVDRCPQSHLPLIYARSKIFVLPSIITQSGDRDGIPNVLAEAMAMGLPVISTRLPNIAELVEDRQDGLLVPEKDARSLEEAIEYLLFNEERCKALGNNARKKISKQFNAKENIKHIARLFEKHM